MNDATAGDHLASVRGSRSNEVHGQVQGGVRGPLRQRCVECHRHGIVRDVCNYAPVDHAAWVAEPFTIFDRHRDGALVYLDHLVPEQSADGRARSLPGF